MALARIEARQGGDRVVERHQVRGWIASDDSGLVQIDMLHTCTALDVMSTSMIDQDAPHHLGRNSEEMGTILPAHAVVSHQAQVGLVHEGGRLERVAAALTLHIAVSQAAEFFVHDGGQAVERALVSIAPGSQTRADVLCTQFVSPIRGGD